ncbi:sensory rhodopsin transducer [Paenibacillus sp. 1781tsa1]|uniref:sensory rhodopsin transducer n=1 Tax=Paenibacillus sp. 1781tsa1 TaxID=2953810 RepID=UPI00209CC3D5|nr:sensory rhodopsin transducer [Paenibacillus sp. 1781tsa1]MCP1182071.1 sensory rhodopsin transducer [Paenibacillus sp. 1781tsa1]
MTLEPTKQGASAHKNDPTATGHTYWVIPDGYIPPESSGTLESHESICVLNTSATDAELHITIYFEDREPLEDMVAEVQARRTKHIRTASLQSGEHSIPSGVPYAITVSSNIPVIIQYSRLDTTQPELALMSVMAYPLG